LLRDDGRSDDLGRSGTRARDPSFPGYDTYLDDRMKAVLPACLKRGTKIVSNQGWINPEGAAQRIVHWLREFGAKGIKVAAVGGSLITDRALELTDRIMENGEPTSTLAQNLISAEVYLGAEPIAQALREGARIVVTGRVADPSIFMAPMMYEFGWDPLDHARVGMGSGIGHLMECGAQVTGGYFSDPGFKDVPEPWNFGFPIAEVDEDGSAVITKVAGTGGAVNLMTVKEQLLYEVHDPATTSRRTWSWTSRPRSSSRSGRIGCACRASREAAHADLQGLDQLCGRFIGEDMFFYAGPARCAVRSSRSASWKSGSASSACRPKTFASTSSG
jgi:hypothetical protein